MIEMTKFNEKRIPIEKRVMKILKGIAGDSELDITEKPKKIPTLNKNYGKFININESLYYHESIKQ